MEPEEYGRLLTQCQLQGVGLRHAEAELRVTDPDEVKLEPAVTVDSPAPRREGDRYHLERRLLLTCPRVSGRGVALRLSVTYAVTLRSEEPLPEEFLDLYAENNLEFNLWPYWRRWLSETTSDMGLLPLQLPFRFQ